MDGDRSTVTIRIEKQVKNEWCWAAVSASVHKFFQDISQTQCQIAATVLKHQCCDQPSPGECNVPQPLHPILDSFGVLRAGDPISRQLTFDEVRAEIDAGRPFCVLIKWLNNGQIGPDGHYIAINGYRVTPANKQFVSISDPLFSDSEYDFTEFTSTKGGYHDGQGVWTMTYRLVKPATS
jgi:hypothetical protein